MDTNQEASSNEANTHHKKTVTTLSTIVVKSGTFELVIGLLQVSSVFFLNPGYS